MLVLPTLQYGHYPAFLEYPGSISVRAEACRDTVIDICQSLASQGAKRFYVLNTGISTIKPLEAARSVIVARGFRMEYTDIRTAYAALRRQVETQPAGTHADEIETSMMLYIAPDSRPPRPRRTRHPPRPRPRRPHPRPRRRNRRLLPDGRLRRPHPRHPRKGQHLVEGMVQYLVETLRRISAESVPALPPTAPAP